MKGIAYRAHVEKLGFELSRESASGKEVPYQKMTDFLEGKSRPDEITPKNSVPSGIFHYPLFNLLPKQVVDQLQRPFINSIKICLVIFLKTQFCLHLKHGHHLQLRLFVMERHWSLFLILLYPLGEGAGYAGGITSAAVDGIKAVTAVLDTKIY